MKAKATTPAAPSLGAGQDVATELTEELTEALKMWAEIRAAKAAKAAAPSLATTVGNSPNAIAVQSGGPAILNVTANVNIAHIEGCQGVTQSGNVSANADSTFYAKYAPPIHEPPLLPTAYATSIKARLQGIREERLARQQGKRK